RAVLGWELRAVDLAVRERGVHTGTRVQLGRSGFAGSGRGRAGSSWSLNCNDGSRALAGFKGTIRSPLQSAISDSLLALGLRDGLAIEPTLDHGDSDTDNIPLRQMPLLMRMEVVVDVIMRLGCHKSRRGEAEQKDRLHPHQEGTRKYRKIECGLLEGRLD